jgi:hypothetical protein
VLERQEVLLPLLPGDDHVPGGEGTGENHGPPVMCLPVRGHRCDGYQTQAPVQEDRAAVPPGEGAPARVGPCLNMAYPV